MRFSELFRYANSLWLFFALYFITQYRPVRVKRGAPPPIFCATSSAPNGVPLLPGMSPRPNFEVETG